MLQEKTMDASLNISRLIKAREYWLDKLSGELVKSEFPYDYKLIGGYKNKAETLHFHLPENLSSKLKKLSNGSPLRMYMVLAAGVAALLEKYTGSKDVMIGSPILKQDADGDFINKIIVLRNYFQETMSFKDLLLHVRQNIIDATENQNCSIENIIPKLNLPSYADEEFPLFDVSVLLQGIHEIGYMQGINTNMNMIFIEGNSSIDCKIEYNSLLYKEVTIEKIFEQLSFVLEQALEDVNIRIADMELLNERERKNLLFDLYDTDASFPEDKTIHQLFEESVAKFPENIAVEFEGAKISYRELNKKANKVARLLRKNGVAANTIVAMLMERSIEMIVGILGIVKAGGAYLPLDPDTPKNRILSILEDSHAPILLTQNEIVDRCALAELQNLLGHEMVLLCDIEKMSVKEEDENLEIINKQNDLAYIIYTSGSSGMPKGVMVEHQNVVRLLCNNKFQFEISQDDIWTMFHSYNFDFSVWEMYGALLYGGKLIVIPKIIAQNPLEFLKVLYASKVTVLNQTPSAFYNLSSEVLKQTDLALPIKYIIFGGEALAPKMLKGWKERYPQTKLINMYGITETTVHVTYREITDKDIELNISNIGKPIPTLTSYIMDKNLKLLPIGVAGELCVGGKGVARGYLNRPELTNKKFVDNPYKQGERMYRSGDLAKVLPDGNLEYLGRIDRQVKIRGHRIELGEIENKLLHCKQVNAAVVALQENQNGNYLCAYYVSNDEIPVDLLKSTLSEELPSYMIPSYFMHLESMPMTPNGKVNINALPLPVRMRPKVNTEFILPTTTTEKIIADIWIHPHILDMDKVSIRDNFFELGGHSLQAAQIISRLSETFQMELSLRDLFDSPTIEGLAKYIDSIQWATAGKDLSPQYDSEREGIEI